MPGQLNLLFNKKVFAQSIAEGVISSLVLFFIPYGTFNYALRHDGLDVSDLHALATVISAALIVVVTLRVSFMLNRLHVGDFIYSDASRTMHAWSQWCSLDFLSRVNRWPGWQARGSGEIKAAWANTTTWQDKSQCSKWDGMGILALLWPAWNHTTTLFWQQPYRNGSVVATKPTTCVSWPQHITHTR